MLTLDKQEVEFNELVPEKSSKHVAAVAFVSCAFPQSPGNADLRPFSMIVLVCLLLFWRYCDFTLILIQLLPPKRF